MAEAVILFLLWILACSGCAEEKVTDSVPAAITVYRNPDFFNNLPEQRKRGDGENSDVDREDSAEFYDFDDDYKYPGEPKKPNPPAAPDFTTYYDESPEFQPEPRDVPTSGAYREEGSDDGENELNEDDYSADEQSADSSGQEEDEPTADEFNEEDEDPPSTDNYNVHLDEELQLQIPPRLYEESKDYYNPVLKKEVKAFDYPTTYEDLDYYSRYEKPKKKSVDKKKGTREYLKDHSVEEIEEPTTPGNVRSDSKHVFRTVSKFGIHALKPMYYVPHIVPRKIKSKHKYFYKPKKLIKWGYIRETPDDSAYFLSSDYDSDFEFF